MNGSSNPPELNQGPDPELEGLPAPRRPWRRVTLLTLGLTAVGSCLMVAGLWGEVTYSLAGGSVVHRIGDVSSYLPTAADENRWVQGTGELKDAGGIRFRRPLEHDGFRLVPVVGNPRLWVELRVPEGFEGDRFVAPTSFVGRLVRLDSPGIRRGSLSSAVRTAGWQPGHLRQDAWVLLDGETPASTRWAVALVALFAGFAVFSLGALASLLRPIHRGS